MNALRNMPGFVRLLVAAFLAAQLAGVVSVAPADAHATPAATPAHVHHHAQDDGQGKTAHHHGDIGDGCCALHAFFAGILPMAIAIDAAYAAGEPLVAEADERGPGVPPSRLDRPPRPLR
jgi:hypothetical protein